MKYNYRPDIDGIRAISVLLVLFFHAGIFGIKAGFIGVDIFFVISGFLITTGIKNGLESGNFSFVQFFKKRLWRLQPVFIVLLLITAIFTTITYLPDDFLKFTDSAKWAAQFQANSYFAGLETGYFADDTSIMPLLHTWSLSIEWQWYFVLPFLMFGFYKILKVEKLDYWVFPLTIVMIIVAFYTLKDRDTPYYYYSFIARIFEMLIGSCLAGIGNKGANKIHPLAKVIIGIICLWIIGYAAFSEKVVFQYPNWWAVRVCIAGALLIYIGGGSKSNLITKFLSFKPLVFIGAISYSLYIWHWPVFAFTRNLGITETGFVSFSALGISFILACLSYYFIENRFRKLHTISFWKTLCMLVVIPLLLLMTLNTVNKRNDGFPNRFGHEYLQITKLTHQMKDLSNFRKECWENKDAKKCIFGDLKSDKKAVLIGDSFANHAIGFVDVLASDAQISIVSNNFRSCLALDGIEVFHQNKLHTNCMGSNINNYQNIRDGKFNYVIIAEAWHRYFSNNFPDRALALEKSIQTIVESGAIPVIITNTYDTINGIDYSKYFYQSVKLHTDNKKVIYFTKPFEQNNEYVRTLFSSLQNRYPSLILIDMGSIQCTNNECLYITEDNYPVYRDNEGHITDYASHQFGKLYLEKNRNPLK